MKGQVTILGCGNSSGVPAIGNRWGNCDPHEAKNARTRSSMLLSFNDKSIVVDTGQDFRDQLNREDVPVVHAALITHSHGDHVCGLDDLRYMTFRNGVLTPVYGSHETLSDLNIRFAHLLRGGDHELYRQTLEGHPFANGDLITVSGLEIQTFAQDHGTLISTGYRFGNFGYSLDMVNLDNAAIKALKGIDIWVVDCAAYHDKGPVHANIDKIYRLNQKIGARQVYLSSLSIAMDYQTLLEELKPGYEPAYDGLQFDITL